MVPYREMMNRKMLRTALPMLRELRRDALAAYFSRPGRELNAWWTLFPALAAAARDPHEAACLSWLVAEMMPNYPESVTSRVYAAEAWMKLRHGLLRD